MTGFQPGPATKPLSRQLFSGLSVLIHEPSDLSLKLTAFDRYRTTTDPGFQANDLDYLLAISWGF